jgi:hypothetical protein
VEPAGEIGKPRPKDAVKAAEETAALPMFRWPVRGHIIASFGSSMNGGWNDDMARSVLNAGSLAGRFP